MTGPRRPPRRLTWAVRAFPPRWRRHSAEELLATVLDSAQPGRNGVPVSLLLDIVAAGWRERLRDRPPLRVWWRYGQDKAIPTRWNEWVGDDVDGRWFYVREWLRAFGSSNVYSIVAFCMVDDWLDGGTIRSALRLASMGIPTASFVVVTMLRNRARRAKLARQGIATGFEPGRPLWTNPPSEAVPRTWVDPTDPWRRPPRPPG